MKLRRASLAVVAATLAGCGGRVAVEPTPGDGGGPPGADAGVQWRGILASSSETLYAVKPPTGDTGDAALAVIETVTTFEGCDEVTDIAMSSAGKLYATTPTGLYTVDRSNGTCTLVAKGAYPDSLAFLPPGTVDPVDETLAGYAGTSFVRIDPSTGAITTMGPLGADFVPGSDLAADPLGNVFLAAKGVSCDACLVRIDPTTGALAEMIHPIDSDVSGLAHAGGRLYGVIEPGLVVWYETTKKAGVVGGGFATMVPSAMLGLSGATAEP